MMICVVIRITGYAQDPGSNPDAPIDGGIALLNAGAVALGLKNKK